MEDLNITVGADISNFKRGMDDAQKELAQTALAAGKMDSALKKAIPGTNQAANALQNLGRVAQDAPFGFIGIQNNINPLLESFQRLKKETGSTTGAFKALISQLGGAGGIGLAVSVATGVLTVLAQSGFFNTKKAADEAGESLKKFKDDVKGVYAEAGREAATVSGLIAVLKNETETRERKNEALKELKKINPEVFGQLKQEEGAVIGLDSAYKAYLANFKLVIAAKILQIRLEDKTTQLLKAQGIEQSSMAKAFDKIANSAAAGTGSLNFFQKKQIETSKVTNRLNREIADLNNQLTELSKGVTVKPPPVTKPKAVKDIETLSEFLAKVKKDIADTDDLGNALGLDKAKDDIAILKTGIEHIFKTFKDSGERQGAVLKLTADLDERELAEKLKARTTGAGAVAKIEVPLDVTPPKASQLNDTIQKMTVPILKAVTDFNVQVSDVLNTMMSDIASGIGQSIGDALSGKGDFAKELFTSIFQTLGNALQQLGKVAIETGIGIKAIKAAFKTLNPFVAIAAGVGLIALGAIIKNSVGNAAKFATGGFVSGPGSSTSDSINARLSRGEYVIKADSVTKYGKSFFDMINGGSFSRNNNYAAGGMVSGNIGGGQLITVEVVGNIRGNDIFIANKRAGLKIGRNG